ncbi:hypothetical protein CEXT_469241 [Caerostris extrusa]|uniref:Uncharacterized protein n=1 Tax=Caerostris extrusa TaxID=172846 RepID=A0AAV4RWT7_CAEEX|nr:hypothetical protein CEXT_469241 [Caerostris extrusa]
MSLKEKEVTTGKNALCGCEFAFVLAWWEGWTSISSGSLPKDTFSKWPTVSVTESARVIDQGEVKFNEGEDLEMTRKLLTPSCHMECTRVKHTNINCSRYY